MSTAATEEVRLFIDILRDVLGLEPLYKERCPKAYSTVETPASFRCDEKHAKRFTAPTRKMMR